MLGMAIRIVSPGEPTGTYHWETDTQDGTLADARFPPPRATRYPAGLLPD